MKELLRNIMRFFLPVLFLTYLVAVTSFTHTHMVNGVTIVHSHPYDKHAKHHHTAVEFQLIRLLSIFESDGAGGFNFLSVFIPIFFFALLVAGYYYNINAPYHGIISLRAPPVTL